MSTHSNTNSLDDARTDDERVYPAEDAYGPRHTTPAWRRPATDLSVGYSEMFLALHAAEGLSHEEDPSS